MSPRTCISLLLQLPALFSRIGRYGSVSAGRGRAAAAAPGCLLDVQQPAVVTRRLMKLHCLPPTAETPARLPIPTRQFLPLAVLGESIDRRTHRHRDANDDDVDTAAAAVTLFEARPTDSRCGATARRPAVALFGVRNVRPTRSIETMTGPSRVHLSAVPIVASRL